MTTATATEWLTPSAIAQELGIDPSKVTHWLNTNQLRGVDVAENRGRRKRWRIKREWLDQFLAAREQGPTPAIVRRRSGPATRIKEIV